MYHRYNLKIRKKSSLSRIETMLTDSTVYEQVSNRKPDIRSMRDRLGFYAEIQITFGTV